MSSRSIFLGIVATILSVGAAGTTCAQGWQPFAPVDYRHDFAPFETFDIKNMSSAPDHNEGFFFGFDKLSWVAPGEKNAIGNPNVQATFPNILRGVDPPLIFNGLTDAVPEATFGWGERYEFGYIVDHHGWTASVLDGPDVSDIAEYGFLDGFLDNPNNQDNLVYPSNPGFGNVIILFDSQPNTLLGFLYADVDGDGTYEVPYDLDGDIVLDLDDLITYLPSFDLVRVRNNTELDGVEVMKAYRFKPTSHGSLVEFSYGARYLRLNDNFRVEGLGGPFSDLNFAPDADNPVDGQRSFWDTTIENHIVGPQVALRWAKRQGRFAYNVNGRFTFGYNVQDHDQSGQVITAYDTQGAAAPPVNIAGNAIFVGSGPRPIYLGNYAFRHGKQEQEFSPLVEFRTEVSYYLAQDFALKLGFNATFVDNIRRASSHIDYTLPAMGFVEGGTEEIFVSGINFGAEFNR
jgi:hypothetical protein